MGFRSLLKRALTDNVNDKFYKVEIGQVFLDRYRVETHLGSGRYASVWLVIDSTSVFPLSSSGPGTDIPQDW